MEVAGGRNSSEEYPRSFNSLEINDLFYTVSIQKPRIICRIINQYSDLLLFQMHNLWDTLFTVLVVGGLFLVPFITTINYNWPTIPRRHRFSIVVVVVEHMDPTGTRQIISAESTIATRINCDLLLYCLQLQLPGICLSMKWNCIFGYSCNMETSSRQAGVENTVQFAWILILQFREFISHPD